MTTPSLTPKLRTALAGKSLLGFDSRAWAQDRTQDVADSAGQKPAAIGSKPTGITGRKPAYIGSKPR